MKITGLETIHLDEFPNILFVQVHTDEGLVGLGETFFGAQAVAAYVHETAAPLLLGKDPLHIERHATTLRGFVGFQGTGVELRGASAIDVALWDVFGQVTGQPIYQLLGGPSRDRVRVYNTCAGYRYVRGKIGIDGHNWGLPAAGYRSPGPYEDLDAFMTRADELAESLLEQGITGMKIWPFDVYAFASGGLYISDEDLQRGLEPFRKIRRAVGNKIDVMVELHAYWNLPTAIRIAKALEEVQPFWLEDPIKMNNLDALAQFAASTHVPTTASETLGTRWSFREMFEKRAVGVAMLDVGWVGGLSEARKIGTMAEAYALPIAPHDCTGPVVWTASVHLSIHAPNALIQESVRAYYSNWYRELVTELPRVEGGYVTPPPGPGLGTALLPEIRQRADAHVRSSRL